MKSDNSSFNRDLEIEKFNKLFEDHDLASEGWSKVKYRIGAAPIWPKVDYEFIVHTEKS